MENYTKGQTREVEMSPVFVVDESCIEMKVNSGSRIQNLMGFALRNIKEPNIKTIIWSGSGKAVVKAISCAGIMQRKVKNLHQVTKLRQRRIEEYWEPKMEGLERLKVNRDIPAISILLSKEPVETSDQGDDTYGPFENFWKSMLPQSASQDRNRQKHTNSQYNKNRKKNQKPKAEKPNNESNRGGRSAESSKN